MISSGRLPWPTPQELDPARRTLHDAILQGRKGGASPFPLTDAEGRLHGPFNAFLLAPAVGTALQELGQAIRYRGALSDREREIAILLVAVVRRSEFEWYAHDLVGRRIGIEDEELNDISELRMPATLSPGEEAVWHATLALLRTRDLDDDLYASTLHTIGQERLGELIMLVGYYDQLALILSVWRTPLPAGVAEKFGRSRDKNAAEDAHG